MNKIILLISYITLSTSFLTNYNLLTKTNYISSLKQSSSSSYRTLQFNNKKNILMLKMVNNLTDITVNDNEYNTFYSKGYITKINFDKLFLNIFSINKLYISSIYDRVIICYNDYKKNVYYIENEEDKTKINYLISLLNNNIKIIIISDFHNIMDSPFGYLFCETK